MRYRGSVILLVIFIHAGLGLRFALCARDRARPDGHFASPAFVLVARLTVVRDARRVRVR